MSTLKVDTIVDSAGTGPNYFSQGFTVAAGKPFGNKIASTNTSHVFSDSDGIRTLLITAGSSGNPTVTLPAPSNNTHRKIRIKKVDAGTAHIVVSPNSTETIEGSTANNIVGFYSSSTLTGQYSTLDLQCDGSNWHVLNVHGEFLQTTMSADVTHTGITTTGGYFDHSVSAALWSINVPPGRWRLHSHVKGRLASGLTPVKFYGFTAYIRDSSNNDLGLYTDGWRTTASETTGAFAMSVETVDLFTATTTCKISFALHDFGGSAEGGAAKTITVWGGSVPSYFTAERIG